MQSITLAYVTQINAEGSLDEAYLERYYIHTQEGKLGECYDLFPFCKSDRVEWQIRSDDNGTTNVVCVDVRTESARDVSLVKDDFLGVCELAQMDAQTIRLRPTNHLEVMKREYTPVVWR